VAVVQTLSGIKMPSAAVFISGLVWFSQMGFSSKALWLQVSSAQDTYIPSSHFMWTRPKPQVNIHAFCQHVRNSLWLSIVFGDKNYLWPDFWLLALCLVHSLKLQTRLRYGHINVNHLQTNQFSFGQCGECVSDQLEQVKPAWGPF